MNAIVVGIVAVGLAGFAPLGLEAPAALWPALEMQQDQQPDAGPQLLEQRTQQQAEAAPRPQPRRDQQQQQQQQQQQGEQRELIDINAATAEQLQRVPGIGETLARRIIEFREEHGPFEKVDDLLNVQGIGTTSLDKMRPFLTVKPKQ
jgi:comEA protein